AAHSRQSPENAPGLAAPVEGGEDTAREFSGGEEDIQTDETLESNFEIESGDNGESDIVEVSSLTPRSSSSEAAADFDELFARWRATGDPALRDRLILMHRHLVSFLARRFADRGESVEDIV